MIIRPVITKVKMKGVDTCCVEISVCTGLRHVNVAQKSSISGGQKSTAVFRKIPHAQKLIDMDLKMLSAAKEKFFLHQNLVTTTTTH